MGYKQCQNIIDEYVMGVVW